MTASMNPNTDDLPPDNATRLAIYDVVSDLAPDALSVGADELFDQVIPRLRVLVPRELHLAGERRYFDEKLNACIEAGIVGTTSESGALRLSLTGRAPQVRFPDGEIHDYTAGLEPALERIDRVNAVLRDARFDVRTVVPSSADNPNGAPFRSLVASMREHGFLKQFPVVRYQDDVVIDGRARLRAAAMLHLDIEYMKYASDKDRTAARRRDTPLNRVLLVLHANADRLTDDVLDAVHARVARATGRTWNETAADLQLTSEWRRSSPSEYSAVFEVKQLPYRAGDEPKIQVTADHKVKLRSVIEAAGLAGYKIDVLRDYVPFERARSGAGPKAVFARAEDIIKGIATMQADRRGSKLKLDPEWEHIRDWLLVTFAAPPA